MRNLFVMRSFLRFVVCASLPLVAGACSSVQTLNEAKLMPDMRSFLPSNANTYSNATAMRTLKPTGPEDLVDGQGGCAGAPPTEAAPVADGATADGQLQFSRPVALEMTECEVARALGAPANIQLGADESGRRSVVMTYTGGDRPGIYRFAAGRLVSIERAPEAAAPAKPEKKTGRKTAPAKKPAGPNA
jgi:hypothetical protein